MFVRRFGASREIKHGAEKLRIFSSYSTDQFARPTADIHEMGNVAKIICMKDGRCN